MVQLQYELKRSEAEVETARKSHRKESLEKRGLKTVQRCKVKEQKDTIQKDRSLRVESEETQDHVSQSSGLSVEEEEELSWVPIAISIAQRPICKCDNHCSDKALGYWQSAEVLVDDGEEVRTRNLCQQCYNEELKEQGEQQLKSWEWRALVEQTAQRRKLWRNVGKCSDFARNVGLFIGRKNKSQANHQGGREEEAQQGVRGQCSRNFLPWKS